MGFFSGLATRLFGKQEPSIAEQMIAGAKVTPVASDQVSAYQDEVINQQHAVMDNWSPSERHLAKPKKRQPIKARKALKKAKTHRLVKAAKQARAMARKKK